MQAIVTSSGLQMSLLLFAVLVGQLTCSPQVGARKCTSIFMPRASLLVMAIAVLMRIDDERQYRRRFQRHGPVEPAFVDM